MDAAMWWLAEVVSLAVLIGYAVLMAVSAFLVVWIGYNMVHYHWTLGHAWDEARHKFVHL